MPIPAIQNDAESVPVCCEKWFDLAETLMLAVRDKVRTCFAQCADIQGKVTHGEPIGGDDYVATWLIGVSTRIEGETQYGAIAPRLTYGVAVCLGNYPMPAITDGGKLAPVPSPAEYMHASYYTYGVAEVMWAAVANTAMKGKPNTPWGRCSYVSLGTLGPQDPALFSARWGMTVTATI